MNSNDHPETTAINDDQDNEYYNIDMEELEYTNKKNVIKVAKSMGINSFGNKGDILERIKKTIEKYKESKEIAKFKDYKFDVSVYDLPIKDIDKCETLFWRVFRNKFLFKQIVTYLTSKFGIKAYKYDDIINVNWMLDNNYIELLKDKIKLGRLLSFTQDETLRLVQHSFIQLLSTLDKLYNQQQHEIKEVIILLFRNYSRQFGDDNNKLKLVIESKSIIILDILVKEFNIKLNIDQLYLAVKIKSVKLIKYVLGIINKEMEEMELDKEEETKKKRGNTAKTTQIKQKNNEIDNDKIWESVLQNALYRKMKSLKTLNYLIKVKVISTNSINNVKEYEEFLNFLFGFGPIENEFKLSGLIEACYYICNIQMNKENKVTREEDSIDFKEIEEIKSKFNEVQLKSKLIDILSTKKGIDNQDIKKLYEFYLGFKDYNSKSTYGQLNKLYYNIVYNIGIDEELKIIKTDNFQPYMTIILSYSAKALNFAHFKFFKSLSNGFVNDILQSESRFSFETSIAQQYVKLNQVHSYSHNLSVVSDDVLYPPILFSNCYNNQEKEGKDRIFDFLNEMIGLMKIKGPFKPSVLFYLLIQYDDVELLKYYIDLLLKNGLLPLSVNNNDGSKYQDGVYGYIDFNQFLHNTFSFFFNFSFLSSNIYRYIRSNEMIDFIYNNFKLNLFLSSTTSNLSSANLFVFLGRTDLLLHLEQLLSDKEFNEIGIFNGIVNSNHYYETIKNACLNSSTRLLKSYSYMLSKPFKYQGIGLGTGNASLDSNLNIINTIQNLNFIEKEFNDLKFIIENTADAPYYPFKLVSSPRHYTSYKDFNTNTKRHPNEVKLLNWILSERKFDFIEGGRCKFDEFQYSNALYLTGRIDELFNNQSFLDNHLPRIGESFSNKGYSKYNIHRDRDIIGILIGVNGDLDSLKRILNLYSTTSIQISTQQKSNLIMLLLLSAVQCGRLNIFEYLFQNHKEILLKKSTDSPNGWYPQKEFKELITLSIKYDQLHLYDFFIKVLGYKITKLQFTSNIPPLTSIINILYGNK